MFNLDEEQTSLKMSATDTYNSITKINSFENMRLTLDHLNLQKVKMTPQYFCLNTNIGGQNTSHKNN